MFFVLAKEYCRTLFAYEGTNEDELTFKEGDNAVDKQGKILLRLFSE